MLPYSIFDFLLHHFLYADVIREINLVISSSAISIPANTFVISSILSSVRPNRKWIGGATDYRCKAIPYTSITAVQFKRPGFFGNREDYLQLSATGDADEPKALSCSAQVNGKFAKVKEAIENALLSLE